MGESMKGNIKTAKKQTSEQTFRDLCKSLKVNKDEIIVMIFAKIWEETKKIIQEEKNEIRRFKEN